MSIFVLVLATYCAACGVIGFWAALAGEQYYGLLSRRAGDRSTTLDLGTVREYAPRPWSWFLSGWPRLLQARINALGQETADVVVEEARRRYVRRRRIAYGVFFVGLIPVFAALGR